MKLFFSAAEIINLRKLCFGKTFSCLQRKFRLAGFALHKDQRKKFHPFVFLPYFLSLKIVIDEIVG